LNQKRGKNRAEDVKKEYKDIEKEKIYKSERRDSIYIIYIDDYIIFKDYMRRILLWE